MKLYKYCLHPKTLQEGLCPQERNLPACTRLQAPLSESLLGTSKRKDAYTPENFSTSNCYSFNSDSSYSSGINLIELEKYMKA